MGHWSDKEVEALYNAHASHNGNWNSITKDDKFKILHSRSPEALRKKWRERESRKQHTRQEEVSMVNWTDKEVEALHNACASHHENWKSIVQDNKWEILHSRTPEARRWKRRQRESRKQHTPQEEDKWGRRESKKQHTRQEVIMVNWSDKEVEALDNAYASHHGNWKSILQDNKYKILHSRTPQALRWKRRQRESRKHHTPQEEILEARSTIHLSPNSDDVHPNEPSKIGSIPLTRLFWNRLKARNVSEETCGWLSSTHLELFCKRIMQQRKETDRWLVLGDSVFRSLLCGFCNEIYGNGKKNLFKAWWEVDKIFSPICIDEEHWVLGELDLRRWRLTTYNSLNDRYGKSVKQMFKKFKYHLPKYLDKIGYWVEKEKPAKFRLEHFVEDVPQQVGGRDCGVFVCWYMESLTKTEPLTVGIMGITDESRRDFATKYREYISLEICKVDIEEETSST